MTVAAGSITGSEALSRSAVEIVDGNNNELSIRTTVVSDPNTDELEGLVTITNINTAPKLSPPALADYCSVDRSVTKTETFTYKSGGSGGALLRTITIVYADEARTMINSITSVDP